MKHLVKRCLTCRYFRPKDTVEGICRIDKTLSPDYPIMGHEDVCASWLTAGQQYYIRAGWVKKQLENKQEDQQ